LDGKVATWPVPVVQVRADVPAVVLALAVDLVLALVPVLAVELALVPALVLAPVQADVEARVPVLVLPGVRALVRAAVGIASAAATFSEAPPVRVEVPSEEEAAAVSTVVAHANPAAADLPAWAREAAGVAFQEVVAAAAVAAVAGGSDQ
jgi:hypothetical protein